MRIREYLMPSALAILLAAASAARAQSFAPRAGYVFPAGGRQGRTVEVQVCGQFLRGAHRVHVSGDGVRATVIEYVKPTTLRQVMDGRDKLKELQQQRPKTAEIGEEIAALREMLLSFDRNAHPALVDTVRVEVTVEAGAAPGPRDLRLLTPRGLTNPVVFCVGQLPECCERETTNPNAYPGSSLYGRVPQASRIQRDMPVTVPTVINGQIMPGDVDRFRFEVSKGQRVVASVCARALVPYLADAVPGWFQATVALYDADGNEVAYADDYRYHPDPVLVYDVPADGELTLEIRDAIYRGRKDFVYRIALGEIPFITTMFPLGGRAGQATPVEVSGWNVTPKRLTPQHPAPGTYAVTVEEGAWRSNARPFAVDTLPECLEEEPNGRPADAQPVSGPVIVNGRIARPRDADVFRFEGGAGEERVAEVLARRLASPLDSRLRVTDTAGRTLAANDDHVDKGAGLHTHHADSYVRFTVPADGVYLVSVTDAQQKGGPAHAYRLRVSPPRPDFALRVAPSAVTLRGVQNEVVTVYALRRDGFDGPIRLALTDNSDGFVLGGGMIPAGQDHVRVTLSAPPNPARGIHRLHLEGRARVAGHNVVRQAAAAEDLMQAFAYRHLVPADEWLATVNGRGGRRGPVRVLGRLPLRIPAGGTASVRVGIPAETPAGKIELELSDPPDGIALRDVAGKALTSELVLEGDADTAKAGLRGNLIVSAFLVQEQPATDERPANVRRIPLGVLPAMPFEIVDAQPR